MTNISTSPVFPYNCDPREIVQYDGYANMSARAAVIIVVGLPIAELLLSVIFRDSSKNPSILTVPEIRELSQNISFMTA